MALSIIDKFREFIIENKDIDQAQQVRCHDGTYISRRNFESEFHKKIDRELHDPDKALLIAQSFTKHFRPVLSSTEISTVEDWIIKNVRFLGAFPFNRYWQGVTEGTLTTILSKYQAPFNGFFEEIRSAELSSNYPVVRDPKEPFNIVIITTTGGGGHKSVADALAQILNQNPLKYRVSILDIAVISKPSDPVYRVSGLLSGEEVYDKIYQQEKQMDLANKIWQLKPKLEEFVSDTSMKDLKGRIRPLKPDLIVSSCHFWERDLEAASALGVPLRFVHCDYEISLGLLSLIAKGNPQVVKVWLPAKDPEILRPVSTRLKSELISQLQLSHSEEEIDQIFEKKMQSMIDYSGYPVRSSFNPTKDAQTIASIRQRFGVAEGSQVVAIQMGKQGVGSVFQVVKTLNEDLSVTYDCPVHIGVMCGTNEKMRQELLDYLESHKNHPQINFDILPLLGQQDTADYLKIAEVELMKPGGAATSEALQMRIKTLIYLLPEYPWEKCNSDQLIRHHAGENVDSLEAIPLQLKRLLAQENQTDYQPIPADQIIPNLVDEAINIFDLYNQDNLLTDAVFERTSPEIVTQIYVMLETLNDVLKKHGITYWIDGGTLLGAVRHKGLIPWDDDGDIQIFEKDREKLLALAEVFSNCGYRLVDHEFGLKLFPKESYFPSIDIFTAAKDSQTGNYVLGYERAKKLWPNDYWTEEELTSIKPLKFGPIELMGCEASDRYLTTLYEKNYLDIAYQIYNHAENKMHFKRVVRIVDRNPAQELQNKEFS